MFELMRRRSVLALLLLAHGLAGCAREPAPFSDQNASALIRILAGAIGSRPIGTPANARARAYIIGQVRIFGFDVRVQEAEARAGSAGLTARVSNIIAVRAGRRPEAIGLLAHYDSVSDSPAPRMMDWALPFRSRPRACLRHAPIATGASWCS
jgi:acetylornithine deacetylase/succinyl-diaminopimelate desuccinylase-like protein